MLIKVMMQALVGVLRCDEMSTHHHTHHPHHHTVIIIVVMIINQCAWSWTMSHCGVPRCQGKAPRTQPLTMISSSSSSQFWWRWQWWCCIGKDIGSFDGKSPLSSAANNWERENDQHDDNSDYDSEDENDNNNGNDDDDGKERETSDHLLESPLCPRLAANIREREN